jgi:1-deoxy-D-xylulose-5-phosphate reductoisomerase
LLGSTGSIGRSSTLKVAGRTARRIEVVGLALAGSNVALANRPARPESRRLAIHDPAAPRSCGALPALAVRVHGPDGLIELAALAEADMVLVAIVGTAGLHPALAAIEAGKDIAVASKEILVMAGEVITGRGAASGVRVLPVDSEHNAIFQCLHGHRGGDGGPAADSHRFRRPVPQAGPPSDRRVTPAQALKHPTWDMGPKITIDSATLFNKGLEMIEARWLFDIDMERIDVVVHPQSIVHSMVEFRRRLGARPAEPHGHVFSDPIRAHLAAAGCRQAAAAGFSGPRPARVRGAARRGFPALGLAREAPGSPAAPCPRCSTPPTRWRSMRFAPAGSRSRGSGPVRGHPRVHCGRLPTGCGGAIRGALGLTIRVMRGCGPGWPTRILRSEAMHPAQNAPPRGSAAACGRRLPAVARQRPMAVGDGRGRPPPLGCRPLSGRCGGVFGFVIRALRQAGSGPTGGRGGPAVARNRGEVAAARGYLLASGCGCDRLAVGGEMMKSKPNLTRFTYETTAFQGWRLSISRGGHSFTRYFSDRQFGGERKALAAASAKLEEIKEMLAGAPRKEGKLTPTAVRKAEKLLKDA